MHQALHIRTSLLALLTALLLILAIPSAGNAQVGGEMDLRATIRAAILSDPRTAEMSEAEIDAMVGALAEEASVQGVGSSDIMWRPIEYGVPVSADRCGSLPEFFCTVNEAFGFDGSDFTIPIGLGVSAAFLLFVIGSLLLHRHGHHPVQGAIGVTPPMGPAA